MEVPGRDAELLEQHFLLEDKLGRRQQNPGERVLGPIAHHRLIASRLIYAVDRAGVGFPPAFTFDLSICITEPIIVSQDRPAGRPGCITSADEDFRCPLRDAAWTGWCAAAQGESSDAR